MTAKQHGSLSAAAATLKYEYVFLGFLSNKHLCLMLASSALACDFIKIGLLGSSSISPPSSHQCPGGVPLVIAAKT